MKSEYRGYRGDRGGDRGYDRRNDRDRDFDRDRNFDRSRIRDRDRDNRFNNIEGTRDKWNRGHDYDQGWMKILI
jgi:hypothetical protein